jgi:molybdopterin molybdotransferase
MEMFKTRSDYPVISLDQAWAIIASSVAPLAPRSLPLDDLLGLVLAETVRADEDSPAFDAATMDGYAIIAIDDAPERFVLGEQEAGSATELRVSPGTAMRIMTGAPMPAGANAVIPVEQTREIDRMVSSEARVRPGENVRRAGSDLAQGQVVLAEGTLLGPAEIGLLATVGRAEALVCPRPVVAVAATGNELVEPGQPLAPGQIRDSNSYALRAIIRQAGAVPLSLPRIADTKEALRATLDAAADQADVVLTSGGVSMGTRDLVKPVLAELGTVHFGRVAIKPGKPLTYATVERDGHTCHFFGLPGNPVSSLVTFEMVVRPVLRLLAGRSAIRRRSVRARLAETVRHEADRTEFVRATLQERDGEWLATTTGSQASSRLASLAGAQALLVIPQGVGDVPAGDWVEALLINAPEVS